MLSFLLPLIITAGAAVVLLSALAAVLWLVRRGLGGASASFPRARRFPFGLLPRLLMTCTLLCIGFLFSLFVSGLFFPLLLIPFIFRWRRPRRVRTRRFRRFNGYEPFWRYPGPAEHEEGPPIDTDFRHMN